MSRHSQALRQVRPEDPRAREAVDVPSSGATALQRLPTAHPTAALLASSAALRQICEHLSPIAVIERNLRLIITGCRPEDGASTIAMAFALDLSQRLSLRTLLIDANSRRPTLHRAFARLSSRTPELVLDGPLQIRSTGWTGLDLATCYLGFSERERREAITRCDEVSEHYAAVVIDLGVVRLDARMLPLARPTDPILLVARYGQTRRQELATAASSLAAAKRTIAGVILNRTARPNYKEAVANK